MFHDPVEGVRERPSLALVVGTEHPDRDDGGRRRERVDDARAGRPVTQDVAGARVLDDVPVVIAQSHAKTSAEPPSDRGMIAVAPEIDDRDCDAIPARVPPVKWQARGGEGTIAAEVGPAAGGERL